ncbi:AMP-binding enzyme [Biscogniauxia marginata]|nr:AMP-binding enzyme [Biscogniauxia marginata]
MSSVPIQQNDDAIAIIGSACRFAGDTDTISKLWSLLNNPMDVGIAAPKARFNHEGFYHKNAAYHDHSNTKDMRAYFLSENPVERWFDAKFFGINPAEAHVLDPQVRLLLETTYEALETAGQTMESLQGSDTGCFVGMMLGEYEQFMMRDPESIGMYHLIGTARNLISNRLSYFFDWRGPSMTIDTACSSSLVAVHQAVQLLRSRQSRVAIAAGSNLILDPITYVSESKLQMLSPNGESRMWDASANGYARGEGVATVVLKRLSDAIADGDDIECIIRETGINQDGKTRGITLPSAKAQAALIRDTYSRAGLDPKRPADWPQYFEAHGTGTPAGDPIEAEAIHSAFFGQPTEKTTNNGNRDHNALLVGSIKTVLGHTEGTAGIAGILKATLALQHSVVPPNLLFKVMNPRIEPFRSKLQIPTSSVPWPPVKAGDPRRASVNSFGFGGTNSHVILESYNETQDQTDKTSVAAPFVFSAASEKSLYDYLSSFLSYVEAGKDTLRLRDIAYTLHTRRSRLPFATALAAPDATVLIAKLQEKLEAGRSGTPIGVWAQPGRDQQDGKRVPFILGVFTGQGAQWARMGADLLSCPAASDIVSTLEERLARLPSAHRPSWSLREEMERGVNSRVSEAELSQVLCLAVQIVLVNIIRSVGINFSAVVGHSSGEIAAAYAAGIISADDAVCIAYYRGLASRFASGRNGQKGAMMAVGTTAEDALELVESHVFKGRATIAAQNSSSSLTLSGDQDAIEELKIIFEDEDKFVRLLKVDKAYHSHHMLACAEPYVEYLRALDVHVSSPRCTWISSVSGDNIVNYGLEKLKDQYWVDNAVSPVLFRQAVQNTCLHFDRPDFDLAIEIGPHPALRGPAVQTIQETTSRTIQYTGLLKRGSPDVLSIAEGLGFAWTHLSFDSINLQAFEQFISGKVPLKLIKGIPKYSWDHAVEYWHESRQTRSSMCRRPTHELLGNLTADIDPNQELKWRHILTPTEISWLKGHRLQGQIVFPAAGYVALAIEACRELIKLSPQLGSATLIQIHNIDIHQAMTFDADDSRVEAVFSLDNITHEQDSILAAFRYSAASSGTNQKSQSDSSLRKLASGGVKILLGNSSSDTLPSRVPHLDNLLPVDADDFYESLQQLEYEYTGPFRALSGLRRRLGMATGFVSTPDNDADSTLLVHPGMLDAAIQAVILAKTAPFDGNRIVVNPNVCERNMIGGNKLPFDSYQRNIMTASFKGDVDIYPSHPELSLSSSSNQDDTIYAMIQVEGLDCVPFSPATIQDDKELMSKAAYDISSTPDSHELELARFLERVAFYYLQNLQRSIPDNDPSRGEEHPLSRLYSFAKHIESRIKNNKLSFWKKEWFDDNWEAISLDSKPFRIGENLVDIVKGKTTAIELAMKDELLNEFYPKALVKHITYRFPHLNILEIGAGTGGATKAVLDKIGDKLLSYTFTDDYFKTSPSSPRIIYNTLDISKNPLAQGYVEEAYDVIIASQVLHATPSMRQTLQNTRRLLKPGGYLVVNEGINNDAARLGTIFGAFPGWWLGAKDDGRVLGPYPGLEEWNELLQATGFSGCDSFVPIIDPLVTPTTCFISQAVDARINFLREPFSIPPKALRSGVAPGTALEPALQELLLVGGKTPLVSKLVHELNSLLHEYFGNVTHIDTFAHLAASKVPISFNTTVLSLTDIDEPLFRDLTESTFESLKKILHNVGSVLWVTEGRRAKNPFANMTVGMVRSAIIEIPTLRLQFLDFEGVGTLKSRTIAEALLRFKAGVAWTPRRDDRDSVPTMLGNVEREFVLDNHGQLLIPRLIIDKDMNDRYNSARRPIYKTAMIDGKENGSQGKAAVSVRLDLERREYYLEEVEQQPTKDMLRATHSLLLGRRIKSLGNAHISLGRDDSGLLQLALSHRISSAIPLENLPPIPVREGGASEHKARLLHLVALNIQAMDIMDGLSQGEHLVIYEPDLTLATILKREARDRMVNVTIMTSTLSDQRCEFLGWSLIHPQAPARAIRNILPENASVFLICDGRGQTDLTGIVSRIIPYLPSRCRVVSVVKTLERDTCGEPANALDAQPDLQRRLRAAVKHAQEDMAYSNETVPVFPVSRISEANTILESSRGSGVSQSVVVEWEGVFDIPINIRPVDERGLFSDRKTFWLAGLTGSLGLSLCEWMAGRGARYFILTSRRPKISSAWLDMMKSQGVTIKVHANDVTNPSQTESLYHDIRHTMPPIGGVASGAMVLMDTTLTNMSVDALQKVCAPKVKGTVCLDNLFRNNDLDFFVVFSSITAVTGNPGLSNYTAANLFMTSLAQQRRQRGLSASVIHIAAILGAGYITEKSSRSKTNFTRTSSGYTHAAERDFHQLFAEAVIAGHARSDSGNSTGPLEIAIGLQKVSSNSENPPYWFDNPTMSHFVHNGGTPELASKSAGKKTSVKALLMNARNREQVTKVLIDAIKPFIYSLLQVQNGSDLDDARFLDLRLDDIGLDSLLAVEIRTWWLRTVNVNLPVMKILSGLSIGQLLSLGVENLSPTLIPNVTADSGEGMATPHTTQPQENGHAKPTGSKTAPTYTPDTTSSDNGDIQTPGTGDNTDIQTSYSNENTDLQSSSNITSRDDSVQVPLPAVEKWMDLSFSQTMFWFVLAYLDDNVGLNHTVTFRITGPIRVADLERAIIGLGNRHEALRTCFRTVDRQPKQGIMEKGQLYLERRHIYGEEEVSSVVDELQNYSYDFERGECLRTILLELSPTDHFLLFGTHSLVLDGGSSKPLLRELLQLYENDPSIADRSTICQYPAFAQAQLEAFKTGKLEEGLRFWRTEFSSFPPPLPILRISQMTSRPVQTRYDSQRADFSIDATTKTRIWNVCRRYGIRPFHFFLTAFRALLSQVADEEEICIGIGDANRSHEGALGSLGPYVNLLPLRFSNDAKQPFEAGLRETKGKADAALTHSFVPFQVLLDELSVPRSVTYAPIFQAFFDYRQGMRKSQPWGDCELQLVSFHASKTPYDISMDIIDDADSGECLLMMTVRDDMYSKDDAELLVKCYATLVQAFANTPEEAFAGPKIYETEDVERALNFGQGDILPSQWPYDSVFGRIQAIANSTPDALAVKLPYDGKSLTYRAMMTKSQEIAAALVQDGGCTTGSVVAVYQEPTPDWLCSILAIFSIGAVCVPLDADVPIKRLVDMASDSKASVILADSVLESHAIRDLAASGTRRVIDVEKIDISTKRQTNMPPSLPSAGETAMILYTSGSTGIPKGIAMTHRGFKNWAEFIPPPYLTGDTEVVLQQSSSGFDMAYIQVFYALCYGGTLCLVPRAMRADAGAITDIIAAEGVTATGAVPSEYLNWLQFGNRDALGHSTRWKTAISGGEPGTHAVVELHNSLVSGPKPRYLHIYGPTEITFFATGTVLSYENTDKSPSVGIPFPNYTVYVLDEHLRPVPPGIQGEIYIGGAGVASGYQDNATLTADRFVLDPRAPSSFLSNGWTKMHRTGDNGRWRDDGALLVEGRRSGDTQHKLRGLRVDFQEVENVMMKEAKGMLRQVVVSVRRASEGEPEFLIAHAVFDDKICPPEGAQQQQFLNLLSSSLSLPRYMWPAATVAVRELPHLNSGKLDRRAVAALPLPEMSSDEIQDSTATDSALVNASTTERLLKKMWEGLISKDIIKLHRIGENADFFHVGGTSLLMLHLQAQIRETFGVSIPLVHLFESSTLKTMARRIDNRVEAQPELVDWDAETAPSDATESLLKTAHIHHPSAPEVVVLTGATGLLGQGFLQALLADSNIRKIHCVAVRNARERLSSIPHLSHEKVILHEGDLSSPRLGLDENTARAIFEEVDCVLHNGADTSHLRTYHSLRDTNLKATREIVDLCLLVGRKTPIHYISTASVLQYSGLEEFDEESASLYPPPPNALDGYSASKWASERYLERVHERSRINDESGRGWPIWIHRPTYVQGDRPPDDNLDIVHNLLKYCKLTNAVPVSPNLRGAMNLVSLDRVVANVLQGIFAKAGADVLHYIHDVGNINIPLTNIKSFIDAETGGDSIELSLDKWARRAAGFGLDPILVAFFADMVNMPPVTWQHLRKKGDSQPA